MRAKVIVQKARFEMLSAFPDADLPSFDELQAYRQMLDDLRS